MIPKKTSPLAVTGMLLAAPLAVGAELEVTVEVPRLGVAEYHRPYVAVWIEKPDQSFVANAAVWYQLKDTPQGERGSTWLKDLRSWWRKSGRELTMPVDGISGATRPPGTHKFLMKNAGQLPAGSYQLVVEAARETGGREIIRVPFSWPAPGAAKGQGASEIGQVQLAVKP